MPTRDQFHPNGLIPTTVEEIDRLGWGQLDVILVSGDTLIDCPTQGISFIARVLLDAGYRVGVIAQPNLTSDKDIKRLGEPRLFWGVSAGAMDSMVANYTALGKPRRKDDLTPGGKNDRRPDRACIVYSQLIRRYFKHSCPVVLGGIEASLRRISHYDAWTDSVRRSILFDAKADVLVYGMGEQTVLYLAQKLAAKEDFSDIRGLCYITRQVPVEGLELPAHEEVCQNKLLFCKMFDIFINNTDPYSAQTIYQKQDTRYLVQNPPSWPISEQAFDHFNELPYSRRVHPYYSRLGRTLAMDTVAFSLTTHRGCYGQCRFCAISAHQGRTIVSRSQASLLREASTFVNHSGFKGIISDVGGPTANMYKTGCVRTRHGSTCPRKNCLFPEPCRLIDINHNHQIQLLRALRHSPGVRKVFIASGIRYDLIVQDRKYGRKYLEEILAHHISGQMKIAPEHIEPVVLDLMGKPDRKTLESFLTMFENARRQLSHPVFLTYYLMAAHPGCALSDMVGLRMYAMCRLKVQPEQVQIFTPTPATYSTVMYHTEIDPFSHSPIFVEKSLKGKKLQKEILFEKLYRNKRKP